MKKVLKWIAIVIGVLIGVLVLAVIGLSIVGGSRINKTQDVQAETIALANNEATLARGEHLVKAACTGCPSRSTPSGISQGLSFARCSSFPISCSRPAIAASITFCFISISPPEIKKLGLLARGAPVVAPCDLPRVSRCCQYSCLEGVCHAGKPLSFWTCSESGSML